MQKELEEICKESMRKRISEIAKRVVNEIGFQEIKKVEQMKITLEDGSVIKFEIGQPIA